MPLSFLCENSKRRSIIVVKLLTYSKENAFTNCISVDMFTSSREITLFYQTVEMGSRHPNYGREIARERPRERVDKEEGRVGGEGGS